MSFTRTSTGSTAIAVSSGALGSNERECGRPSTLARSMRNPSTPYTVTQCRSASQTSRMTVGEPESSVLPVPVMSASWPLPPSE